MTELALLKDSLPAKADVKRVKDLLAGIRTDGEKVQKLFASMTQRYFAVGEYVFNWILDYRGKMNITLAAEAWGTEVRQLSTALKIYKLFKDNPSLLDGLTLQDTMRLLREKSGNAEPQKIEYEGEDEQPELDWEELFAHKPIAKVRLVNYRINMPNDHELWLVKRGMAHPTKAIDVWAAPNDDDEVRTAHREMLRKIQAATEEFYAVYEKQEAADDDIS